MKTKTITTYQCEYCLTEYRTSTEAHKCEANCLGLTLDEYDKYLELLSELKKAYAIASSRMNDLVRARCDYAANAVVEFEKKHGITDNK